MTIYMKKSLLALSLLVLTGVLYAQTKDQTAALKAFDKAQADVQNPKKSTTPAAWLSLANAYTNIWELPSKNIWTGTPHQQVKTMFLKSEMIFSTEDVNIGESVYLVDKYADKNLYYDEVGSLTIIDVTKRLMDGNLLDKAYEALMKANEYDTGAKARRDIAAAFESLHGLYIDEAMSGYHMADFKKASEFFELSLKATENPVLDRVDTMTVYYTAVTAQMIGDNDKALKYYNRCKDLGFYDEGALFGYIAEIYIAGKNFDEAKQILSEGFVKYPTNQSVLVNLINLYLESNEDPMKIIDLIQAAQENEPTNASLYYAEGKVYKDLGDIDKAVELFEKSYQINPEYTIGIFYVGVAYYDKAVEIQEQATNEPNDAKYYALVKDLEEYLKKAIDPFEKAFESSSDPIVKTGAAEYLKQIYFRFRDEAENYSQGYDKYAKFLEEM